MWVISHEIFGHMNVMCRKRKGVAVDIQTRKHIWFILLFPLVAQGQSLIQINKWHVRYAIRTLPFLFQFVCDLLLRKVQAQKTELIVPRCQTDKVLTKGSDKRAPLHFVCLVKQIDRQIDSLLRICCSPRAELPIYNEKTNLQIISYTWILPYMYQFSKSFLVSLI